eukprot:3002726-Rhodomonas_salina.1
MEGAMRHTHLCLPIPQVSSSPGLADAVTDCGRSKLGSAQSQGHLRERADSARCRGGRSPCAQAHGRHAVEDE